MPVDTLPPLRDVIARHGLSARKSLGQNFILDLNLTSRIARAAGDLTETLVIEVGPGPGGLTRGLLAEGAAHVIAIERDDRVIPALEEISAHYPERLSVIPADALEIDYDAIIQDHVKATGTQLKHVKIVANLPYSVGTALLVGWLGGSTWPPFFHSATLMFQKEVADRIVATPGNKAYGRLAIMTQWRANAQNVLSLPPEAFTPPPKVASTLVQVTPSQPRDDKCKLEDLERITAAAFGQRRKMLRASLKQLDVSPIQLLETTKIKETARAEELSVADYVSLAIAYRALKA